MPVSATFSPPSRFSGGAGSTSNAALKAEVQRLHRENARLLAEVASLGETGSFESLQLQNARLVRQVSLLSEEGEKLKQTNVRVMQQNVELREELDSINQANEEQQVSLQAQIEGLKEEIGRIRSDPQALLEVPEDEEEAVGSFSYSVASDRTVGQEGADDEEAAPAAAAEEPAKQWRLDGRNSPPPPPPVSKRAQRSWAEHEGNLLEPFLRSGAYVFVDAFWLVEYFEQHFLKTGKPIPKRADLPPEAIIGLEGLKAAGCPYDMLPILTLSHMWFTPAHPDPKGDNLAVLAKALKPLVANGQRYGLFWDVCSMICPADHPSGNLDEQEKLIQKQALHGLHVLYSHPFTTVIRLTHHPEGYPEIGYNIFGEKFKWDLPTAANVNPFMGRGWTFCEAHWISWAPRATLDLSKLVDVKEPLEDRRALLQVCKTDQERLPPLLVAHFKKQLDSKTFVNVKEDQPLLNELYTESFEAYFGKVRKLDYSNSGWTDEILEILVETMSSGVMLQLEWLLLSSNRITDTGMKSLARVVAAKVIPNIVGIVLDGNPGNSAPVVDALQQGAIIG